MANEKRLIDANGAEKAVTDIYCGTAGYRARERLWQAVEAIKECPTVDAVEVEEIRVDIERICLENQEVILNVSICGKPNEVKLPFSKDVAEVVHGRWEKAEYNGFLRCDQCKDVYINEEWLADGKWNYCPNCGAKMDGDGNG